jgi:hypothetical protein
MMCATLRSSPSAKSLGLRTVMMNESHAGTERATGWKKWITGASPSLGSVVGCRASGILRDTSRKDDTLTETQGHGDFGRDPDGPERPPAGFTMDETSLLDFVTLCFVVD